MKRLAIALLALAVPGLAGASGPHDFDFDLGVWKTHVRRLQGSSEWAEYDGTHTVQAIWGGRGFVGELQLDGPAGHIEAVSPRLFDPKTGTWRVSFANSRGGTLGAPSIGEFKDGRGVFYSMEEIDGRPVLVRGVYFDITPDSNRYEQALSTDGGETWKVNWTSLETRIK